MFTELETCFTVYPEHTNSLSPLIFGGAFFSEMDKVGAIAVKRFLYDSSVCHSAVTHKAEVSYNKPCYLGDLIFLHAKIQEPVGKKSVAVKVEAWRETSKLILGFTAVERESVAVITFVFVSITDEHEVANKPNLLPYHPHGIKSQQ